VLVSLNIFFLVLYLLCNNYKKSFLILKLSFLKKNQIQYFCINIRYAIIRDQKKKSCIQ